LNVKTNKKVKAIKTREATYQYRKRKVGLSVENQGGEGAESKANKKDLLKWSIWSKRRWGKHCAGKNRAKK